MDRVKDRKSYGQFCALARALDHVGDRWTLLIVRELLGGERTYRSLMESLPGISPNLMLDRLRHLNADGLVERNDTPIRSKHVTYALTPAGRSLTPVVLELIRWGARYMASGPDDDRVDPAWTALALQALLDGPSPRSDQGARLHLDIDGQEITITTDGGRRRVTPGHDGVAAARLSTTMPAIVAVASGQRPWRDLNRHVDGDPAVLPATLTPGPPADLT